MIALWLGPVPGAAAPVPAQQRVGGDEPALALWAGERGCYRAEQRPIVIVEVRAVDLATEHAELMAQHDDLEVLRATRAHRQSSQRGQEPIQNAVHEGSGSASIVAGQTPATEFPAPTGCGRDENNAFGWDRTAIIHGLGHVLGFLSHTADGTDVMSTPNATSTSSPILEALMRFIYSVPAGYRLPADR